MNEENTIKLSLSFLAIMGAIIIPTRRIVEIEIIRVY